MKDESATDAAAVLPELSDARVDEIESRVFDRIGQHRHTRARTRRRGWLAGASAAAAIVLVVAIAPVVGNFVRLDSAGGSAVAPAAPGLSEESGVGGAELDQSTGVEAISPVEEAGREIIATATATVRVDDVSTAVRAIAAAAEGRGGYVESSSVGSAPQLPVPIDGSSAPAAAQGGYITVRVPAGELTEAISELEEVGEVEASGVSNQDVTAQAIDLRARIDASQTSVDRLTDLIAQAASVADLIAAESALAERQATLESYQQQLKALDEQVALSSLSVTVVPRSAAVDADPAGFGDGVAAGWNGLVATLNALVVAVGFLLPWIIVAAVAAAIVWAVVRLVRRRRRPRDPAPRV